jgi:hypothetical protein
MVNELFFSWREFTPTVKERIEHAVARFKKKLDYSPIQGRVCSSAFTALLGELQLPYDAQEAVVAGVRITPWKPLWHANEVYLLQEDGHK